MSADTAHACGLILRTLARLDRVVSGADLRALCGRRGRVASALRVLEQQGRIRRGRWGKAECWRLVR